MSRVFWAVRFHDAGTEEASKQLNRLKPATLYSRLKTRSRVVALDARVWVPHVPLAVRCPPDIVVAENSLLLEILDLAGSRESFRRKSRFVSLCELSFPNLSQKGQRPPKN